MSFMPNVLDFSAMLWRKSHVSQLFREGTAFMMKWHFADIKIGQFVLDVECSCWVTVSRQDGKVHVVFSDWPRFTSAGEKLSYKGFQLHLLILIFYCVRQTSCQDLQIWIKTITKREGQSLKRISLPKPCSNKLFFYWFHSSMGNLSSYLTHSYF